MTDPAIRTLTIAGRPIGRGHPPFIVAEMSGNHNQSLERALALVDAAAAARVHALKIQTYTPDTMTLDLDRDEFFVSDPDNPWQGVTLYELYRQAQTPWEWHHAIFERCRAQGLIGFSTPFDDTAVAFLERCGAPCYKISSFEATDLPLLRCVARTGKPVIVSTGMMTEAEIAASVAALRGAGCVDLVLLKCTSTYPASPADANLATIPHLRAAHGCEVGLSDHSPGIGVALAAIALGATVIEKHLTMRRSEGGVDAAFSMEPAEMASLAEESLRAWQALGTVSYGPTGIEAKSLAYRRSLYAVADIAAGAALTRENVRAIRPGRGLAPGLLDEVLGRRAARAIARGTPIAWDLLA